MTSLLDTGNEMLIKTPSTVRLNSLSKVAPRPFDQEDRLVMTFKTTVRDLDIARQCLVNELHVNAKLDRDVTDFVNTTIPRLSLRVFELMTSSERSQEIEQTLFEEGVMITLNPKDRSEYHVYLTNTHYFVAAATARRAPSTSTQPQAVDETVDKEPSRNPQLRVEDLAV